MYHARKQADFTYISCPASNHVNMGGEGSHNNIGG